MNWKYTSKGEYPQPSQKEKDEIRCLVFRKGWHQILCWNAHYECWDDEEGDDYFCDKEQVEKWEYLENIINTLDVNSTVIDNREKLEDPKDVFSSSTPYFGFINDLEGD